MSYRPNRLESMPPVVKNLLIINGLMFLATYMLANKVDLSEYLALYHWSSPKFHFWQPITHLFMHGESVHNLEGGFMHLFSNMFALWMFGSVLENYMGSKRFLLFYLICGLGAASFYMAVNGYQFSCLKHAIIQFDNNPTYKEYARFLAQNHSTPFLGQDALYALKQAWEANPMDSWYSSQAMSLLDKFYTASISNGCVGASGAVFGLLFAFGYLFPNVELMMMFIPIPIKAKYFVGFYALFELYAGFQNNPGDHVAHAAHLGGMLIAFIILKTWNKTIKRNYY